MRSGMPRSSAAAAVILRAARTDSTRARQRSSRGAEAAAAGAAAGSAAAPASRETSSGTAREVARSAAPFSARARTPKAGARGGSAETRGAAPPTREESCSTRCTSSGSAPDGARWTARKSATSSACRGVSAVATSSWACCKSSNTRASCAGSRSRASSASARNSWSGRSCFTPGKAAKTRLRTCAARSSARRFMSAPCSQASLALEPTRYSPISPSKASGPTSEGPVSARRCCSTGRSSASRW